MSDSGQWQPGDVMKLLANPIYTGVGDYPAIVTDDVWIKTFISLESEFGQYRALQTMLDQLRLSMAALK
jgi:hypothetical protein